MTDSHPENDPRPESDADGFAGDTVEADSSADALRRERDELFDQLRRVQADYSNFRKRTLAQAETDRQYAIGPLVLDLLSTLDNFERALDAARKSGDAAIVGGLEMVHRQLLGSLAKFGVHPIPAVGEPFDPNVHEALMQVPTRDQPEGNVVSELSKGYRLHDRVLRPSRVGVATPPQS